MNAPTPAFDLVGFGAPIMDVVASVPDSFLAHTTGEKGGMVMVDAAELSRLVALLPRPPALTPGGSAANTTFNATRLGLRTTFVGKLGGDDTARAALLAACNPNRSSSPGSRATASTSIPPRASTRFSGPSRTSTRRGFRFSTRS